MHPLQQHILFQLVHNPVRRYADLKPEEVEGNLFMYHLRSVMKAGWVAKREDGKYELTPEGLRYADGLSLKTFTPRAQPHLVTMLVVKNQMGEYLFLRRKRQPLLGYVTFPYGKIHLGESVQEAADRELKEKTGLSAKLKHRGDGYITIYQGEEPVSEIFFHLFYGENPTGRLITDTSAGAAFWKLPDEISDHKMPSVPDLLKLIETHRDRFFAELTYKLPHAD